MDTGKLKRWGRLGRELTSVTWLDSRSVATTLRPHTLPGVAKTGGASPTKLDPKSFQPASSALMTSSWRRLVLKRTRSGTVSSGPRRTNIGDEEPPSV